MADVPTGCASAAISDRHLNIFRIRWPPIWLNASDCASYVSQIATTRELLGRHSGRGGVQSKLTHDAMPVAGESPTTDAEDL
jgi:hypothetical protein